MKKVNVMLKKSRIMMKMTRKQIFEIINYRLDRETEKLFNSRFEVVFDDIPSEHPNESGSSRHHYCEDDGREYRWFIFKDKKTGEEFVINTVYSTEVENEIMDLPKNIDIVNDEETTFLAELRRNADLLNPKVEEKPVVIEKKPLTNVEKLKLKYKEIENECEVFSIGKDLSQVPVDKINEVMSFLNKKTPYSLNDIIEKVYPICIDYKLNQRSLWQWLQVKRGAWTRN